MSISSYEFHGCVFDIIIIEEENGKFFGRWKCQCGSTGSISRPCYTGEAFINLTKYIGNLLEPPQINEDY